jgi:peptide deformylase
VVLRLARENESCGYLQQKTDHLDGVVYVDKLPPPQRTAILAAAGLNTR